MIVSGFGYTRRQLEPCNAAPTGTIAACCNWRSTPRKPSVRRNWPRPSRDLLHLLDQPQAEPWPVSVWRMAACSTPKVAGCIRRRCANGNAHPQIQLLAHHDALELRRVDGSGKPGTANVLASAPVVVLAGAAEISASAKRRLPLKRIRGQITRLPQTAESQALRTVVCAEGWSPRRVWANTPWAPVSTSRVTT
jgi:tRNA 5-methylaminomethyl-2-thiouridine biosynthesis bifunctional protein